MVGGERNLVDTSETNSIHSYPDTEGPSIGTDSIGIEHCEEAI